MVKNAELNWVSSGDLAAIMKVVKKGSQIGNRSREKATTSRGGRAEKERKKQKKTKISRYRIPPAVAATSPRPIQHLFARILLLRRIGIVITLRLSSDIASGGAYKAREGCQVVHLTVGLDLRGS